MLRFRPSSGKYLNVLLAVAVTAICLTGCNSGRKYVSMGTAPVGGAFAPVGNAIASVLNEHKGENEWKVQAQGTKGSQQNIRMLEKGELQLAMSNSAISYYANKGEKGWDKKFDVRAVVTLAPNIGLFITKKDSGIRSLADLKDKRVAVGPAGAGFEMFVGPVMTAHGVTYEEGKQDFIPVNQTYSDAAALLGDGSIDAAFMGGAVPTPAVTQAATTNDIFFIPYDEPTRQQLIKDYPFFADAKIPHKNKDGKDTYKGLEADLPALDVGSMHLITYADTDEELIYQITKTIWENRAEIAAQHKAALAINEKNAARNTGVPFHPGAMRFYKEIGIWPEEVASAADDSAGDGDAGESSGSNTGDES